MALYREGKAAMAADGTVIGTGTKWQSSLSLIRPGATIMFLSSPIQMAVVNKVVSDTEIKAITTNGAVVASTDYAILLSDSLTVDGLAQDVAETLRYYQSQETVIADAVEFFKEFDFESLQNLANQIKADSEAAGASAAAAASSENAAKTSEDNAKASEVAVETAKDQVQQIIDDAGEQSTLVVLAQPGGASKIGLLQGGNIQQSVMYFTPDQDGAIGDGVNDDSDHVQNTFNKAAAAAIASPSGIFIPQTVKINRMYRVTKTLTIDGSKVRVESDAGGCLYFDPAGTYTDSRGIVVTNNANLAAFIGNAKPLFSGIAFLTTGNNLDLFYAVRGDAVSSNNGACLHHINSCVFRGFNRLFTHGAGGWGWVWMACTATNTQFWLYLTSEADTYERHSFFGCQWGSGGTALYINNPNGKVYWEAGSVDYCTSIATVVSGHFSMSGHYEFTGRTSSLINITGSNASVSLEGMWAIVGNTSTKWYLVNQFQDYQLSIDKLTVIHDGNNVASGLFSNKKFRKGYIYFPSDAAKLMGYFSSDTELLLDSSGYFDFSLSNSLITTASISGGQLRYTGVGGAGTASYLYVDIPIHGASQISFLLTASNTAAGSIPMTKQLLTDSKAVISTLTEGTVSWGAGSASVAGGLRTVKDIPGSAAYIRLTFNGFYLNSTTAFTIESLKVWKA